MGAIALQGPHQVAWTVVNQHLFFLPPCAPRERGGLTVNDNYSILGEDAGQLGGRAEDVDFRHGCLVGDGGRGWRWR